MTVRQNLELGTYARGDREIISVSRLVDALPMLNSLLERHGNQLSGGEQQLIAIARAMTPSPKLLIMDEPSQGLAPVILDQVRDATAAYAAKFSPQRDQGAALPDGSAPWPVAPTVHDGNRQTLAASG